MRYLPVRVVRDPGRGSVSISNGSDILSVHPPQFSTTIALSTDENYPFDEDDLYDALWDECDLADDLYMQIAKDIVSAEEYYVDPDSGEPVDTYEGDIGVDQGHIIAYFSSYYDSIALMPYEEPSCSDTARDLYSDIINAPPILSIYADTQTPDGTYPGIFLHATVSPDAAERYWKHEYPRIIKAEEDYVYDKILAHLEDIGADCDETTDRDGNPLTICTYVGPSFEEDGKTLYPEYEITIRKP